MSENDLEEDGSTPNILPSKIAEPACLGLIGLAIAALVLALTDLGLPYSEDESLIIPWTLFLGATAQLIAGIMDFKRDNIFGATAFTTYSMLWYSVSLTMYITNFTSVDFEIAQYAHGLIGFLIFSMILTIASSMTNKTLLGILLSIDIAIIALVLHILAGTGEIPVGIALIAVSLLSFYGAAGVLINTMADKEILPLGAPVWEP